MKKVKITELPVATKLEGLVTVGVSSEGSYSVPINDITQPVADALSQLEAKLNESAAIRQERTSRISITRNTWIKVAERVQPENRPAVAEFSVRLRHPNFVASVNFTGCVTNFVRGIYPRLSAGNIHFIDRIAIGRHKTLNRTFLYVRACEQFTESSNLPYIDILFEGAGWEALSPTKVEGDVNSSNHIRLVEMDLTSISPYATNSQGGLMSKVDKRKLEATTVAMTELVDRYNDLARRVEALENR